MHTGFIDIEIDKLYAEDLKSLLEQSDFTGSKAFLRSFLKRIVIYRHNVVIDYKLLLPSVK